MSKDSSNKKAATTAAGSAGKQKTAAEQNNAAVLAAASPHQPAAVKVPWNPVRAIGFAAALFLLAQVVGGMALSLFVYTQRGNPAYAGDWVNHSITAQFVFTLLVETLIIGGLYLFLRHYKTSFKALGLIRPKAKDILYMLGGFAVYFALYAVLLEVVTTLLPSFNVNQKQEIGFDNASGFLPLAMTFVSLVILPPLMEEILMRGFLFGSLRKHLRFVWAMLITGVIFAAAHLPEGGAAGPLWVAAIDTFVLSAILCYLREKTGRLAAGMGVHMLKNLIAFSALFIFHLS